MARNTAAKARVKAKAKAVRPPQGALALAIVDTASQASALAGESSVNITAEDLRILGLPEEYQAKVCNLCGNHSASENPFNGHPDTAAWGNCLPWAGGTQQQPRGEMCRICVYTYNNGGFNILWPKLREYCNLVRYVGRITPCKFQIDYSMLTIGIVSLGHVNNAAAIICTPTAAMVYHDFEVNMSVLHLKITVISASLVPSTSKRKWPIPTSFSRGPKNFGQRG